MLVVWRRTNSLLVKLALVNLFVLGFNHKDESLKQSEPFCFPVCLTVWLLTADMSLKYEWDALLSEHMHRHSLHNAAIWGKVASYKHTQGGPIQKWHKAQKDKKKPHTHTSRWVTALTSCTLICLSFTHLDFIVAALCVKTDIILTWTDEVLIRITIQTQRDVEGEMPVGCCLLPLPLEAAVAPSHYHCTQWRKPLHTLT